MSEAQTRSPGAVLCAIAKDEDSYLEEWIDYHFSIGFECIIIYDNESRYPISDSQAAARSNVIVHKWTSVEGTSPQLAAYKDCFAKYGSSFEWMMFLDIDEFLLLKKFSNVGDLIRQFNKYDGVALNWRMFGSSGLRSRDLGEKVTHSFTKASREDFPPNAHVKTIFKTASVVSPDVHSPLFRENAQLVNTSGEFLLSKPNSLQQNIRLEAACINHYFTKSYDEFQVKRLRGRADVEDGSPHKRRAEEEFSMYDANDVEERSITNVLVGRAHSKGICLCIIFNHPHLANIPLLRRLYAERFRHVRFLVPLVRVEDDDVITVYRGSFSHNAYAVDAWPELRGIDCEQFLFVHDDVLLAPALNERNLLEVLGLRGGREGFIPIIQRIPQSVRTWGHFAGPLWRLTQPRNFLSGTGVDNLKTVLGQLPPADDALTKLAAYGAERETVVELRAPGDPHDDLQQFSYFGARTAEQDDSFREHYLRMLFDSADGEGRITIPYPLVMSGPSGDFYLVPRSTMADYIHLSGVLAAAGMFVEIAAPTALALSCDRVRTCADTPVKFDWSPTWRQPEAVAAEMRADPALLGVHPVKLSMVKDVDAFVAELHAMRELPVGADPALMAMESHFDAEAYLDANPDVRAAGFPAWMHYLHHGRTEGRPLRPAVSP